MRSNTTRCPAHAKALATVGRISFTLAGAAALGGCIESPHSPGEPWAEDRDGTLVDGTLVDGTPPDTILDDGQADADATPPPDGGWVVDGMSDALVLDAGEGPDSAPDMQVDAVVWSETTPCPPPGRDHEAWVACCEARGWGQDPNCAAWGPPMPPRMLA